MNPDAQAAADAAMVEIFEHGTDTEYGNLVVDPRWLHTFLANFFDEWLTKIGGEQVDITRPRESGVATREDATPATPIDTKSLREVRAAMLRLAGQMVRCAGIPDPGGLPWTDSISRKFRRAVDQNWLRTDETCRHWGIELRKLHDSLTQPVEVCEWRKIQGGWKGACGCYSYAQEGMTTCWCGKPIREVPFAEQEA